MRNFKNISGDLLAIAYLPKEDRNSALEDLNIIIGAYPDSDISREQKQLIQEIIEDLIKENTLIEGVSQKPKAKTRATKKSIEQVEVVQPEIVEEEVVQEQPKAIVEQEVETITSIEDIDDAF
jgi:hypothetical protein